MLKLKLQFFGHLMQRASSLEKTQMLGKIEGRRSRGWQRMRWLDGITDSMDMSLNKFQEMVKDREAWRACSPWGRKELDTTEWLNNCNSLALESRFPCAMDRAQPEDAEPRIPVVVVPDFLGDLIYSCIQQTFTVCLPSTWHCPKPWGMH